MLLLIWRIRGKLVLSRDRAPRCCHEQVHVENPTCCSIYLSFCNCFSRPLPFHTICLCSPLSLARWTLSSVRLFLRYPLSATRQQYWQPPGLCFSVCMYVPLWTWSVCCHGYTRRSRRAFFFISFKQMSSLTAAKSVHTPVYSSDTTNGSRARSSGLCTSNHAIWQVEARQHT